jgi:L-rhamnose-H+ transport protein
MSPEQQKAAIEEFDLRNGIGIAILSGVMSACFAYGLAAGDPIKALTLQHGTPVLWLGLPVLVVVLIGGFASNFIWCLILLIRNKPGDQFFTSRSRATFSHDEIIMETAVDAPAAKRWNIFPPLTKRRFSCLRLLLHYDKTKSARPCSATIFSAHSRERPGTFNSSSTPRGSAMGHYKFSSWTLHMASIIIFSTLCGDWLQGMERRRHPFGTVGRIVSFPAGRVNCHRWLWQLLRPGQRGAILFAKNHQRKC